MDGADEVVAAPPAGPPLPLEWKFSQVFGERTAGEEVQEGNCPTLYYWVGGKGACFTLSDPIHVFGLGFDSIRFGSCFVTPLLFRRVMLVFASGSLVLSLFHLGGK